MPDSTNSIVFVVHTADYDDEAEIIATVIGDRAKAEAIQREHPRSVLVAHRGDGSGDASPDVWNARDDLGPVTVWNHGPSLDVPDGEVWATVRECINPEGLPILQARTLPGGSKAYDVVTTRGSAWGRTEEEARKALADLSVSYRASPRFVDDVADIADRRRRDEEARQAEAATRRARSLAFRCAECQAEVTPAGDWRAPVARPCGHNNAAMLAGEAR